jgi:hypothetical protein
VSRFCRKTNTDRFLPQGKIPTTIFSTHIRPCRNQRAASSGLCAFQTSVRGHRNTTVFCLRQKPDREKRSGRDNRRGILPPAKPGNAGWSSPVARQAHNLKAAGSNPAPATKSKSPPFAEGFLRLKPQDNPPFPPRKPQPYNANEIGNGDGNHGCVVLDVADVLGIIRIACDW